MANEKHLEILQQGVERWNRWREEHPSVLLDLSKADLKGMSLHRINLSKANLRSANLTQADLREANLHQADLIETQLYSANLSKANLNEAKLTFSTLFMADLSGANLKDAQLSEASLSEVNLSGANLSGAKLGRVNLSGASLAQADLSDAYLGGAKLLNADFSAANLSRVSLSQAQALRANFTGAILTGACIADWQIGSSTILDGVICDYIYRTRNFSGRLPVAPNSTFAPGEFTQRFQILASAQETIDLTFTDGIDWQAFFTTFQELRSQYPDSDLSIQGLERKAEGFIVRLEVNQDADKAAIETQTKQLYAAQIQILETQYEERLRLQGAHLEDIRDLLHFERQERSRLTNVVETMASEQQAPKFDLRGAQFAGGFAETVQGNQIGGVINNYGASLDEINRLITALRDQVQAFPPEQKDNALDLIDDIETDLKKPEPDPGRLGRKLKQLAAAGTAAATIASGAAAFSGNLNDFTTNVLDLTEKLGVPIELVQPGQGTP